jgi:hypothetical protein
MESIKDKIRKLLALARCKGASEGESANAMAMASAMMLKYNIEHIDEIEVESVIWGDVNRDLYPKDARWGMIIGLAIARLYHCKQVVIHSGGFQFVGLRANIDAAEETLKFVIEQLDEMCDVAWKVERAGKGWVGSENGARRHDFKLTFRGEAAVRILKRVDEIIAHQKNQIPAHRALVLIEQSEAQAEALCAAALPTKSLKPYRSGAGTASGKLAGDAIQLQDKVTK